MSNHVVNRLLQQQRRALATNKQRLLRDRQSIVDQAIRVIKLHCQDLLSDRDITVIIRLLMQRTPAVFTFKQFYQQFCQTNQPVNKDYLQLIYAELKLAQQLIETAMIDLQLEAIEAEGYLLSQNHH